MITILLLVRDLWTVALANVWGYARQQIARHLVEYDIFLRDHFRGDLSWIQFRIRKKKKCIQKRIRFERSNAEPSGCWQYSEPIVPFQRSFLRASNACVFLVETLFGFIVVAIWLPALLATLFIDNLLNFYWNFICVLREKQRPIDETLCFCRVFTFYGISLRKRSFLGGNSRKLFAIHDWSELGCVVAINRNDEVIRKPLNPRQLGRLVIVLVCAFSETITVQTSESLATH